MLSVCARARARVCVCVNLGIKTWIGHVNYSIYSARFKSELYGMMGAEMTVGCHGSDDAA